METGMGAGMYFNALQVWIGTAVPSERFQSAWGQAGQIPTINWKIDNGYWNDIPLFQLFLPLSGSSFHTDHPSFRQNLPVEAGSRNDHSRCMIIVRRYGCRAPGQAR